MFYVVLKLPLRLTSDRALTDPKALGQGESGHLQSLVMPCHAWDLQQVSNTISMAGMAPGTYNTVIVPVQTQTQTEDVCGMDNSWHKRQGIDYRLKSWPNYRGQGKMAWLIRVPKGSRTQRASSLYCQPFPLLNRDPDTQEQEGLKFQFFWR